MEILMNNLSYFENFIFVENQFITGNILSLLDLLLLVSIQRLFKDILTKKSRVFNF